MFQKTKFGPGIIIQEVFSREGWPPHRKAPEKTEKKWKRRGSSGGPGDKAIMEKYGLNKKQFKYVKDFAEKKELGIEEAISALEIEAPA